MAQSERSQFVYVTYIRTTPERLWEALTDPGFIRQYWFDTTVDSAWKPGSPWKMTHSDGTLTDSGQVLEIDPPRRMVILWRNEWSPELRAEGESVCTMELEPGGGVVRLSLTHTIEREPSAFIAAVSAAWPMVLSNLKSLLETGSVVLRSHFGRA